MIRIKVCGLTRPEEAQAAVALGADAIGMVFAPSPRQVSPRQAQALVRALPATVLRVGVFVDAPLEWMQTVAAQVGLDRIQLHGSEPDRLAAKLAGYRVFRALRPRPGEAVPASIPYPSAAAFLVDAYVPGLAGGTGQRANWDFARALRRFGKPVILSGGLHAQNVLEAIRQVQPDMVDVSSGVEIRPGVKSRKKMREFIRTVRSEQVRRQGV